MRNPSDCIPKHFLLPFLHHLRKIIMNDIIRRHRQLKIANTNLSHSISQRTDIIQDVLTKVVIDSLRKYQQKVGIGIEDSVTDLLTNFRQKVADAVFDLSTFWMLYSHREPCLFPSHCRYMYSFKNNTLVIVEQPPMARTLTMSNGLLRPVNPFGVGFERFHLALPYVVFLLHFVSENSEERFCNMYVGWRSEPLHSLEDNLHSPYLPNVHSNFNVCTGLRQPVKRPQGSGAIANMSEEVIGHFWNSRFNIDLASFWWTHRDVPEISTVECWAERTTQDPYFILGVKLGDTVVNLSDLIIRVAQGTEETSHEINLRHQIANMTQKFSDELFKGIRSYLGRTKFDRFYPKDVTDNLAKELGCVLNQIESIASGIEIELNNLSEELQQIKNPVLKKQRQGPWWSE
jgi:hypothetical protein